MVQSIPLKISPITFHPLEPSSFDEYIGQEKAKEIVQIYDKAAKKEGRPLPNILFTGTAGLGKTTLGKILLKDITCLVIDGNTVNSNIEALDRRYALVDEIHNMKSEVCDSLNLMLDRDSAHVIGCTTSPGMLPVALRSRFRIVQLFPYTVEELVKIMQGVLDRKKTFNIDEALLTEIAKRGRSTPRRTLQYLSFMMDMLLVKNKKTLDEKLLFEGFSKLGVDDNGLVEVDHKYLSCFPEDGRPIGIQHISARLAVDKETIEQEVEPYLLELGLIDRTPSGRKRL